jgi:endonuclease-3
MKSTSPGKAKKARKKASTKKKNSYTSRQRLEKIFAGLDHLFPKAECALTHNNPFQLLVATILSAQCTDERVNKVTPALFKKYPGPRNFARLDQKVLEEEIKSTGFFRNKARNIIGAAKRIVDDFGGKVPQSMDEMLTLPGVARKTANVVLGSGFGIASGVVVDTHVFRISRRLKLSDGKSPENVEQDLIGLIPKDRWISFGHQIIWFGRKICQARKPLCMDCPLAKLCDAPDKIV